MTAPEQDALYRAMVDDGIIAAGQAAELPTKRAEDAAWVPIVLTPAERLCDWLQRRLGVETANEPIAMLNEVMADAYEFGRRAATNQPEPLHEVACPECGTTIRARMADQPGQDLRELLVRKLRTVHANIEPRHPDNWCGDASSACSACTDGFLDFGELAGHLTAAVQAYVDSQVAAARTDAVREVSARWERVRCLADTGHPAHAFSLADDAPILWCTGVVRG